MAFYKAGCEGHYDFDRVSDLAHKRFIEGIPLDSQIFAANNIREEEEAALICELDKTPYHIRKLEIACPHASTCKVKNCGEILKRLIHYCSPHAQAKSFQLHNT